MHVAVLLVGHYVECAIDDEVVLADFIAEPPTGPVGLWADGGRISASETTLAPMREPRHQ